MRRLPGMKWALLLTGTLAAGGMALAGEGRGDPARRAELVKRFDTNGDGQLDETERQAMKTQRRAMKAERKAELLARFDKNGDGQLDETERQAVHQERAAKRFKSLDTNGDNVLSLDEFKAGKKEFRGRRGAQR